MYRVVPAFEMLTQVMDLRVAIMARCDAIGGLCFLYLLELEAAIMPAGFGTPRLKKSAPAAAAKVIGPIWGHVHVILFPHHRFHNKPEIFGDGISE